MPSRSESGGVGNGSFSVTPNDSNDLEREIIGINVTTAGLVRFDSPLGTDMPIYVAAGVAFPMRATRIRATGTTATGIYGIFR